MRPDSRPNGSWCARAQLRLMDNKRKHTEPLSKVFIGGPTHIKSSQLWPQRSKFGGRATVTTSRPESTGLTKEGRYGRYLLLCKGGGVMNTVANRSGTVREQGLVREHGSEGLRTRTEHERTRTRTRSLNCSRTFSEHRPLIFHTSIHTEIHTYTRTPPDASPLDLSPPSCSKPHTQT